MSTSTGPGATKEEIEAAFFDLDKTIIAKTSMSALRQPFYAGGFITRRSLTRALIAQFVYLHLGASEDRLDRLRESILRITKGWDQIKVTRIVDEALEEIVEPIIFAEALDLIDFHKARGRLVVIVSASPEEIVVPLARHLGVTETISSRAAIDEGGRYTGEMAFYAYGTFKADAMRALADEKHIDLERSYAYSDSYTDVAMLEAVGHPVAVNPDRVLGHLAKDRNWEILRFVRPIRLRDRVLDRVHALPKGPTRIVVGASSVVFLAAIALGAWVAIRRDQLRRLTKRRRTN